MVRKKPNGGTREARPTVFVLILRGNSEIRARLRAPVFRQGRGSESNTIFAILQKEFFISIFFDILTMLNPLSDSWQKGLFQLSNYR